MKTLRWRLLFFPCGAVLWRDVGFWAATIISKTSLCEAFVLGSKTTTSSISSRLGRTIGQIECQNQNRWRIVDVDTANVCCCQDDCCEDDGGIPKRVDSRGSVRNKDKQLLPSSSRSRNPSRREFVAWNSILAGLTSGGVVSIPGTNANELITSSGVPTIARSNNNTLLGGNSNNFDAGELGPYSSVRQYKTVTLSNGMRVLLVNDKTAGQSSAAITVNGAGQFSDPTYLNGLAHLMEHIVLSSTVGSSRSNQGDFQEWIDGDYAEGFSNGFTAYEKVCFHFQSNTDAFAEALERFSNLFQDRVIDKTCQNRDVVKREIRRVNSELNKNDLFSRELYLTKSLINPNHPYSKVTLGSIETLETLPELANINVSKELYKFYEEKYRPDQTILVVVSSASLLSLENMVQSFSSTMTRQKESEQSQSTQRQQQTRVFPPFLLPGKPVNPLILFRPKVSNEILADNLEKISFQWALDQDYAGLQQQPFGSSTVVTGTQIGFVVAEILGRRGPGSLFRLLQKRKWLPEGNRGLPRISLPVDVDGCQVLRLEIVLTLAGFAERSSVVAAVFDYLGFLRGNPPGRELIAQYCTVAQLYGHALSPRPPDAVELALDGQIYGIHGPQWRLMPLPEDALGVQILQNGIRSVLARISDPSNAVTIITASQRAIQSQRANDLEEPFLPFSPASWYISPTTGARYLPQKNVLTGKIRLMTRISLGSLQPPVINPFIPPSLSLPRMPPYVLSTSRSSTNSEQWQNDNSLDDAAASNVLVPTTLEPEQSSLVRDYWALLKVYSHNDPFPPGIALPRAPPEPSSRSLFVLQLLSSRPPRATAEMAANAEIWRISMEYDLIDLAELGAPAGLAYEISYNKYGMRVSFLGLSQNIASYARRISRRMIDHTNRLLEGPEQIPDSIIDTAIRNTERFRMSPQRQASVTNTLRQATASDAAKEGTAIFQSCSGAVCFSQGDLLPAETLSLLADLKEIFRKATGINVRPAPAVPEVRDLLYQALWIPRSASVCTVSGAPLISYPCGRVPH